MNPPILPPAHRPMSAHAAASHTPASPTPASPTPAAQASLEQAVAACIEDIARIDAQGIDRASLALIGARLAQLAARTDLFTFARFPLPADASASTAVVTLHVGADGRYPLQVLSARHVRGAPRRAAHQPHQHPTWAAAACVHGATYEQLWVHAGDDDRLRPLPQRRLAAGQAFTMMMSDIHSVQGDPSGPAMHLLMYGRTFERAALWDPDTWTVGEHLVPAIAR